MPLISEREKRKAEAFTNSLNSILELVETLSNVIGEGNYLAIANHLKILNDNKGVDEIIQNIQRTIHTQIREIRSNETVEWIDKRSRMELLANELTAKARKAKNEDYARCVRCDRRVLKEYLSTHQSSSICHTIYTTKHLTCKVAKTEVNKYHDAIDILRLWCVKTGRYSKFVGKKPTE